MIILGQYSWIDKNDVINVVIPLKGVSPIKVDIQGIIILSYYLLVS